MATTFDELEAGGTKPPAEVKVWDPWIRIFHWSLVILFAAAYATGDELDNVHIALGYAIAGLLAFRIAWGFVGSRHARFRDFVRSPRQVLAYVRDVAAMRARRYLGHNPAGGAMIVALLLALIATCLSGYLMTTVFWGVEWIEEVHETCAHLTLLLVALHVAGVVVSSIMHHENLVRAMITGRKRAD